MKIPQLIIDEKVEYIRGQGKLALVMWDVFQAHLFADQPDTDFLAKLLYKIKETQRDIASVSTEIVTLFEEMTGGKDEIPKSN